MFGNVNGEPFGSLAGDEEVRKILQPVLEKYPDAKLVYDEFHSITLTYYGHVLHLEAIFFPFDEREVAEIVDSCIRCAVKEPLFYDRLEYLKEIFDMFPSAFMDIDKDGRLVLDYRGRQYDLETAYDVRDSFSLLLLVKDMKKNDEYDECVKEWASTCLKTEKKQSL